MITNRQRDELLAAYLDGSLPDASMAEAEKLLESDALSQDFTPLAQYETFVEHLRQACQAPAFLAESQSLDSQALVQSLLNRSGDTPSALVTASVPQANSSDEVFDESVTSNQDKEETSTEFLRPAQGPNEIGRLGGYRVLRKLGEGGMGLVFEAEDIRLKRRVALKVMKPEMAAKELHRQRFLREAQTAAQVEHDHICPIYQVDEDNGVPFIAMPFLKGEALDAVLKRQKPLRIEEAVRIAREVAEGLAIAHEARLVHRDIKPGNIWLEASPGRKTGEGRVKILDFGLARLQTDDAQLTKSGAIMGTPAYMAPEQARGKPVDGRADLFSLGVMLYEMTVGQRPFSGNDTMSILTSLAVDEPTAPNLMNTGVPAELSDLIMSLLRKSPEKRPANATAVAESLIEILQQPSKVIVGAIPADTTAIDPWNNLDEAPSAKPVSRDAEALRSGARKRARSLFPWPLKVAVAGFFLLLSTCLLLPAIQKLRNPNGTLIVQIDDTETEARFKNGELQIFDTKGELKYTIKPSENNHKMPPGEYTVRVIGADGVELDTREFTMVKGGQVKVKVTVKAPPVVVAKKDEPDKTPSGDYALELQPESSVIVPTLIDNPPGPLTIEMLVTVDDAHEHGGSIAGFSQKSDDTGCQIVWEKPSGLWRFVARDKSRKVTGMTSKDATPEKKQVALAAVRSAQEVKLFIDGKLAVKGRLVGHEFGMTGRTFVINGMWNKFSGKIDEVRISKVARYDTDYIPERRFETDKNTLALYHCDEGQGDVLKDSSGNNHHGKIVGAKWTKVVESDPVSPTNYSLSLNGTNAYVETPVLHDGRTPITIEATVRLTLKTQDAHAIVTNLEWPIRPMGGASLHLSAQGWAFSHSLKGTEPRVDFDGTSWGRSVRLAGVWDGKAVRLFVDGKMVSAVPGTNRFKSTDIKRPFLIGAEVLDGKPGWFLPGEVDEVRISSVARYDRDYEPKSRLVADKDTVALYHCDEGQGDVLKDSSGNNHHGKIVGAKWVKVDAVASPQQYQLACDGRESLVLVNSLKPAASNTLTIEAWADVTGPGTYTLFNSAGTGHLYRNDVTTSGALALQVDKGPDGILHWKFAVMSPQNEVIAVSATVPAQLGQRVHVAGVFDGKDLMLFVNGKKQGLAKTIKKPWTVQLVPFRLAGSEVNKASYVGNIHALRISSVARYSGDFQPAPILPNDPQTVALYRFDEGQGDDLKDSSGNNHHGKIVGAKWTKVDETSSPKHVNTLGMEFALVPKGKAWLGGGNGKPGEREVMFKDDFYLGVYEVTQEEWEKVMGTNPSAFKAVPGFLKKDQLQFPVDNISWHDAQVFLTRLNERITEPGWMYRLPTSTEWEYACRGGPQANQLQSKFDYYLNEPMLELAPGQANFRHKGSLERTSRVGSYPSNALGIHDLHGNVWEWCADLVPPNFHEPNARVARGGSWGDLVATGFHRASSSFGQSPDRRDFGLGMRVARVRVQAPSPAVSPFTALQAKAYQDAWAKHLGVSADHQNSIGMKFRLIPPGQFVMGSPATEDGREDFDKGSEKQHEVEITRPYYLGVFEVTQAEYEKIMAINPSTHSAKWKEKDREKGLDTGRFPVDSVSWDDAKAFCKKLSELSAEKGVRYRLPTEAEWEYAFRAGTTTTFYVGNTLTSHQGNFAYKFPYGTTIEGPNRGSNLTVGAYDANPFGLHDMIGNVIEWCEDAYDYKSDYYARSPRQDPVNTVGTRRARRGGGADAAGRFQRAAARYSEPPTYKAPWLGFRIVMEIDSTVVKAVAPRTDPDRKAAEWVLSIGDGEHTSINVTENGVERLTRTLPVGPFTLTGVTLQHNQKVTDAGLANLKDCKDLTMLHLGYTSVSDAGLAHLKDCKKLTTLFLANPKVTDVGVAYFKDCKDLKKLALHSVRITNAGLANFSERKSLSSLNIRSTPLAGLSLEHFKNCDELTLLDLCDTGLNPAELTHFKTCKKLQILDLSNTQTGDTALAHFRGCKDLQRVLLGNTQLTDAGLEVFKDCKNLALLRVVKTSVSEPALRAFHKEHPKCRIEWDGAAIEPQK